jgi:glycosyltransferase involved in cell wall biosynthesis
VRPEEVFFSFQTQSLFDASQEGLPHFVYTDHSCLANRRYPVAVNAELLDPRWVALEQTVYQAARLTFTTSQFAASSLVEDNGIDDTRVKCVYSGTNAVHGAATGSKKFAGRILFIGVDWERKGGPDLLAAFDRVLKAFPTASLRIVGCTPRVESPQVEVLGPVPLEEVGRHLAETDLFCLPSYFEPSAVVLVEAMLHGVPTVSTRVGGTADRVIDGETGFLVKAGDVEALAEAMLRLLRDPVRAREMGEAGLRLARERFLWPAVGARVAGEIRSVLGGVSPPAAVEEARG